MDCGGSTYISWITTGLCGVEGAPIAPGLLLGYVVWREHLYILDYCWVMWCGGSTYNSWITAGLFGVEGAPISPGLLLGYGVWREHLYLLDNIAINDRLCIFCNWECIEDETHFLLSCPNYSNIRNSLLDALKNIPCYKNDFNYIMSCHEISFNLSKCILKMLKVRDT